MASLVAVLLAAALLVPASPATAGSGMTEQVSVASNGTQGTVVALRGDAQIWTMEPDGSNARQVTADGGWRSPSMADDGTILAVRTVTPPGSLQQRGELVRMTPDGAVLSAFVPSSQLGLNQIRYARIHPNGQLAVYDDVSQCAGTPEDNTSVCRRAHIVYADGRDPAPLGTALDHPGPSVWFPGTELVVTGDLSWFTLGDEDAEDWDSSLAIFDKTGLGIAPSGDVLGFAGCDHSVEGFTTCAPQIKFVDLSGPPPAPIEPKECFILDEEEVVRFDTVTFGPVAGTLLYTVRPDGAPIGESTLHLVQGLVTDPCGASSIDEVATGTWDAFWSPAELDGATPPPPPPPPPSGGGSTPPSPDEPQIELLDDNRVDGGGSADPVGQTVRTSQEIWADGGAGLVVLATADRFPDALAGSALAGELGPILVTPFGEQLDPRVQAEITRVTGDGAPVLILGGTAAVTESAASQARAAAGSETCAPPVPR